MNSDIKDHSNDINREEQKLDVVYAQNLVLDFITKENFGCTIVSVNRRSDNDVALCRVSDRQKVIDGLTAENYLQEVRLKDSIEVIDQLRAENLYLSSHINKMISERDNLQERVKGLENLLSDIKDELDGFSGFDGAERAVFIELSNNISSSIVGV